MVYPGNPQGRAPNEPGARGVYLVQVEDSGESHLEFPPTDTVRWEHLELDITPLETEEELLEELSKVLAAALDSGEGRSLVVNITLTGRGPLHSSLMRPRFIEHLVEDLNSEWAWRRPFLWCDRIVNAAASPLDRRRAEGADFMADLLRLERAHGDEILLAGLRDSLSILYHHHQVSRLLKASLPSDEELKALVREAEALAVDLLAAEETP